MIAIVDPAIFLAPANLKGADETLLQGLINDVVRVLRKTKAVIPADDQYWTRLQRDLIRPLLARVVSPRLRLAVDALRSYCADLNMPPLEGPVKGKMWGVKALFDWAPLDPVWFSEMVRLISTCVREGQETLLISRLFEGRNLRTHDSDGSLLFEKLRWRVIAHIEGAPPSIIRCVRNLRNVELPWTMRLDEGLPFEEDGATHPFCVPDQWWVRRTQVTRTVKSRVAWIDGAGRAWASPSTGVGYHWDVYVTRQDAERIGLDQLNVPRADAPSAERRKRLHHVPDVKRGRLASETGWSCD